MDVRAIDESTLESIRRLSLPLTAERNPYLVLGVRGDGVRASPRWTARVYRNQKGQLKLVTNDYATLEQMLSGKSPEREKVIRVDDAGWGFPLGGVMIGATDGTRVETGIVGVEYFQDGPFGQRAYLDEAAQVTRALVERLGSPREAIVEICTGYVNSGSRELLRRAGYPVVVTEITGLLQHELERRFREYIESLGYHGYFDPKETQDPAAAFKRVIRWIEEDPENRLKIAKTGWKYFRERQANRE
jgi:hypothetical protein